MYSYLGYELVVKGIMCPKHYKKPEDVDGIFVVVGKGRDLVDATRDALSHLKGHAHLEDRYKAEIREEAEFKASHYMAMPYPDPSYSFIVEVHLKFGDL